MWLEQDLFYSTQGGTCFRIARPGLFSFTRSGVRSVSLIQEQFPLGDAVGVADECRDRQFLWCARDAEQLQAGFVRQAVALAGVHVLARPHEVFPRVRPTARARQDVVEAAFVQFQQLARILAAIAVALANRLGAELRTLLRHLGEVHCHNHRRHADRATRSAHGIVAFAHRQRDPLVPGDGTDVALALDVERRGYIRCHLAECVLRCANVDRLPIAVQHQHNRLVQYVAHKSIGIRTRCTPRLLGAFEVFVLYRNETGCR